MGMLSVRPEGPTLEARRAESGEGFLGRGQRTPSPPAMGSGERCGVRGRAPENFEFGAFWDLKIASEQCKMMVFVN